MEIDKIEADFEICENCETKYPMDKMYYDDEGVPICPNCRKEIKDIIKCEECIDCGIKYPMEDIIFIDEKSYCLICANKKL